MIPHQLKNMGDVVVFGLSTQQGRIGYPEGELFTVRIPQVDSDGCVRLHRPMDDPDRPYTTPEENLLDAILEGRVMLSGTFAELQRLRAGVAA